MNSNDQQLPKPLSTTKWAKYQRTYRNKNKETCLKCETNYRNTPEAKIKAAARYKKWKELNKQKNAEYQKNYQKQHKKPKAPKEKKPKAPKEKGNSSAARIAYKCWAAKNKNKVYKYHKKWEQTQLETNPMFKIIQKLRGAVCQAFKRIRQNKPTDTQTLLGCSWEEAKAHFESLFQEGMSWNNHGEWHIDHIRPVSLFTEEDMHLMNHISNLQPLWATENLTKGNFYNN